MATNYAVKIVLTYAVRTAENKLHKSTSISTRGVAFGPYDSRCHNFEIEKPAPSPSASQFCIPPLLSPLFIYFLFPLSPIFSNIYPIFITICTNAHNLYYIFNLR